MVNNGEMDEVNMRSIIRQAGYDSQLEELETDGKLEKEDLSVAVKGILEQGTELFGEEEMNDDSIGFKVYDSKNIGVVEEEAEERNSIAGLFNKKELDMFNSKLEEVAMGKTEQFEKTQEGEYIFAILDKLVYTNGNIENPHLSEIAQIKLKDETDIDAVRQWIFRYNRGDINYEQMRRTLKNILHIQRTGRRVRGIQRTVYRPIGRRSGNASIETDTGNKGEVQGQQSEIRNSVNDRDYMNAVKRGDMETAQRLVDEAAVEAGYTVTQYHGTNTEFNRFMRGYEGIHLGTFEAANDRAGMKKGGRIIKAYVNMGNSMYIPYDLGSWDVASIRDMIIRYNEGKPISAMAPGMMDIDKVDSSVLEGVPKINTETKDKFEDDEEDEDGGFFGNLGIASGSDSMLGSLGISFEDEEADNEEESDIIQGGLDNEAVKNHDVYDLGGSDGISVRNGIGKGQDR